MRKSEMNVIQLETYTLIREILGAYDFELDDGKWFDKDMWAEPEIEATHDNGDMELVLEYSVKDHLLTLRLFDLTSEKEIILDLFLEKKTNDVLKCIASFKEKINGDNFSKYISELVRICPKVFTYRNDKAFRLNPDDN